MKSNLFLSLLVAVLLSFSSHVAAQSTVMFAQSSSMANPGASTVSVTVVRAGPSTTAAAVNYTTVALTAVPGTDFGAGSGQLYWPAGDSSDRIITFNVDTTPKYPATVVQFAVALMGALNSFTGSPSVSMVSVNQTFVPGVSPLPPAPVPVEPSSTAMPSSSSTAPYVPSSSSSTGVAVVAEESSSSDDHLPLILGLTLGLGGGLILLAVCAWCLWSGKRRENGQAPKPSVISGPVVVVN